MITYDIPVKYVDSVGLRKFLMRSNIGSIDNSCISYPWSLQVPDLANVVEESVLESL